MWNITNASWLSGKMKDPFMTLEKLSSPIEFELSGLEHHIPRTV